MILAAVLFAGSFLLYLITLNGTIPAYRDSGDLINAIYTLGIAHPPGYPVYVMLGKLFTAAMPWGNIPYRVNVFSAVCAALSVAVLFAVLRSIFRSAPRLNTGPSVPGFDGSVFVAAGTAILYAATPAIVSLARVSEMYTLAGLLGAGIIACAIAETPRSAVLGSFLLGLGFGVHPTLMLLAPLLISFRPREAGMRLGFFLLGFTVILFLWIRAQTNPVQNWGDPSTLENLWRLITRSNYGGLKLHPVESRFSWTPQSLAAQSLHFLKLLMHQWGWVGGIAGVAGFVLSFKKHPRLAAAWVLLGPGFFLLSNLPLQETTTDPILEPYFVLINLIWALWVGWGLWEGLRRIPVVALQVVFVVGVVGSSFAQQGKSWSSYRGHFYAYDLGRDMLRTLPAGAVLYDPDDPVAFTLRTLQLTEHRRDDVALLNFYKTFWGYRQIMRRWPELLPPVPVRSAQELEAFFWTYSIHKRPFYVDLPVKLPPPLTYEVEGVLYRVQATPKAQRESDLERKLGLSDVYTWRGDWRTSQHADFFTRQILNYRAAASCNLGLKYAELRRWDAARQYYAQALRVDPYLAPAYNNLGVADFNQGRYAGAADNYRQAIRYDSSNAGFRHNLELAQERLSR